MSLNAMASPAAFDPGPLVTLVPAHWHGGRFVSMAPVSAHRAKDGHRGDCDQDRATPADDST